MVQLICGCKVHHESELLAILVAYRARRFSNDVGAVTERGSLQVRRIVL